MSGNVDSQLPQLFSEQASAQTEVNFTAHLKWLSTWNDYLRHLGKLLLFTCNAEPPTIFFLTPSFNVKASRNWSIAFVGCCGIPLHRVCRVIRCSEFPNNLNWLNLYIRFPTIRNFWIVQISPCRQIHLKVLDRAFFLLSQFLFFLALLRLFRLMRNLQDHTLTPDALLGIAFSFHWGLLAVSPDLGSDFIDSSVDSLFKRFVWFFMIDDSPDICTTLSVWWRPRLQRKLCKTLNSTMP